MQNFDKRIKFYRVVFIITILTSFLFGFASAGKIEVGYNALFERYLSYKIFEWVVFFIIFGSGILVSIFAHFLKDLGLLLFELMLLGIVYVYAAIYFHIV